MIPVYVIHLPNPERKAKIAAELARVGLTDVTYVHAQEPVNGFTMSNMRRNPRGEFGCALSHVKAIMQAIIDDQYSALFIEDDIEFAGHGAKRFNDAVEGFHYMELCYLGGHPREPVVMQTDFPGIVKAGKWSCAEAYLMSRLGMESFLKFWCDRAGQPNAMFDFILGEFAATLDDAYAIYPPATQQPPGWSQIGQKHDDKRELIRRGWAANLPA